LMSPQLRRWTSESTSRTAMIASPPTASDAQPRLGRHASKSQTRR
jgi:hypothetical protein